MHVTKDFILQFDPLNALKHQFWSEDILNAGNALL